MIILILLTCILSFIIGILIGSRTKCILSKAEKSRRSEIQKLKNEFKNFLEYDGSEQP